MTAPASGEPNRWREREGRRFALVLPGQPGDPLPGARVVERAVSWVMMLFGLLLAAGAITAVSLTINITVSGRGVLEPARVWPVRARETGTISEVLAATGDSVSRGSPLVRLDSFEVRDALDELRDRRRQQQIENRRASAASPIELRRQGELVAAAEAAVLDARASLRVVLVDRQMAPNVDSALSGYVAGTDVALDRAVSQVRGAEAEVRSRLAQVELLQLQSLDRERQEAEVARLTRLIEAQWRRLQRLTVSAPAAGVVLTEEVQRLLGARVQEGDLLFEVGDVSEWRVRVLVSEKDVSRIAPGDSVRVELRALPSDHRREMDGVVAFVGPQPDAGDQAGRPLTVTATGGYRVDVVLDSARVGVLGGSRLRRGYSVEAKIVTRSGNALRLLWGYLRETLGP